MEKSDLSWRCLEEKTLLKLPFLEVRERICQKAAENTAPHRFIVFGSRDWCNVIPVTEAGNLVMIRQFRAGKMGTCLEFPGGVLEASDSDLESSALRELVEETGYEPLPGATCRRIGAANPNPAIQGNQVHSLIVGPVRKTQTQNLDPAEDIEVIEVSPESLPELLNDPEFDHALMKLTLFHVLLQDPKALTQLAAQIRAFASNSSLR